MRLGGRLAAAIDVLDDMEKRHRPVAEALKDWGLSHRFAGAGDRAAIGNTVYDALRRKRSGEWLFGAETTRARAFAALMREGGRTPASLNAELKDDRFAPALLSEPEIAHLETFAIDDAPAAVVADCPDWCAPLFEHAFGAAWVEECAALATRPPLDLRVNTLKADRGRVLAALSASDGRATAIAPQGIRIPPIKADGRHPNVQVEPAFQKGWFEVQDEGSQIVAALAAARSPVQVLDYCAGAGGKTLALSASLGNHGQIFAYDSDKTRLAPIFDRLRRSGSRNVQIVTDEGALGTHLDAMDLVLVDAPCTGSGTWRRRPDAKWRLTDRQLEVRRREQADILDHAARYVRSGGMLAYVTCSLFREENSDQAEAFCERNPAFRPVDHRAFWEAVFPGGGSKVRIDQKAGIVLTPLRTATDGFFFAALERAA
ncbi:MAG: RsmB/NOP family class I SAM-dependent RNA methyltransferase [Rhizobiaceae bacterium]|nr:MAG: RsmB/NOP family class I SAM-dependent RNA methyltransferase [Rhizobiaceae bacterium]